ncbi:MAG: cysteine desulfurase family protein [Candidatus Saccharibacteria bacterium]
MIYLDNAAATPLDGTVINAMQPYWQDKFFNASAGYLAAKQVHQDIQKARASVAKILGSRPSEVIFTAGGTEADNLAINGVMQAHPKANLVISAVEHKAILEVARQYPYQVVPVGVNGLVDIEKLVEQINDKTVLVSVMYANNELGTVQPITKIGQAIQKIKQDRNQRGIKLPLYFHTDASQAPNYLNLQVNRLAVDLMTLNGGKIYGPKQTGALYVKAGTVIKGQIRGGGQEHNLRSGTENVAGIIGFTRALEIAQLIRPEEAKRLAELQIQFESQLDKLPKVVINAHQNRLPNFVHITIKGFDNEQLMMQLDEAGIICAVGSACSASNEEPSHVLKAIGLSKAEAQSSLRFSMGRQTSPKDIKKTVQTLTKLLNM